MKGKKRIQFIGFFLCLLLGNSLFVPKSYAAVAPVKVEIPVSLYAAGDSFPEEEFTVELEPVISGSNLVPSEKEIHLRLGGGKTKDEKRFAPISFSEEGIYQYDIRQKQGDTEYMTYDDREYLVSVKVELQDKDSAGNARPPYLTAVIIVTDRNDPLKQDIKRGEIAFHNRYDKPKPPEPETPPETVPPEPTPPNPNTPPGPGTPPGESGKPPAPIVNHDPGVLGVKKLEIFNPIEEIPKICTKIYRTARNVATGDESGMFFFGVSFSLSLFGISLYFYKRRGKDLSSE
nr:FctA domain-containing protein [uncultured Oribacterium sp.]